MSMDSDTFLQEFRQAVYEKHSTPQSALESSPDAAIQRRAVAYQAWLESYAGGERPVLEPALLRYWVASDIVSLRSVDPESAEKSVAALQRNVSAYHTYAELLKELDSQVYDNLFSENRSPAPVNGFSNASVPVDKPQGRDSGVVLSKLLEDITYRERGDGSVLYLLKDKPIFVDHGQQILMEPGANDDDLAILAALYMAKQKFGGALELTGSEEFKRRAIQVMIKHDVQVELKNPAQESLRRELMGLPPIEGAPADQKTQNIPEKESSAPGQDSGPVATKNEDSSKGPVLPVVETPPIEPVNHFIGEVDEYGSAPYQFDVSNSRSFFVTLKNSDGELRTTWGVDLKRILDEQGIGRGDQVELKNLGRKEVVIEVPIRDEQGKVLRHENRQTHRNEWDAEIISKSPMVELSDFHQSLQSDKSAIATHDAKWLVDMGVPPETFDTHPQMLSLRGEDHAVLLLTALETTPEGYATVEKLMVHDTYRAAFAASIETEFGRYNSHFQKQIVDSEGYAIVREMLDAAESQYGPIPVAALNQESLNRVDASGDLDDVIEGIEHYDRQYLASLELHRQAVAGEPQTQNDLDELTKSDAFVADASQPTSTEQPGAAAPEPIAQPTNVEQLSAAGLEPIELSIEVEQPAAAVSEPIEQPVAIEQPAAAVSEPIEQPVAIEQPAAAVSEPIEQPVAIEQPAAAVSEPFEQPAAIEQPAAAVSGTIEPPTAIEQPGLIAREPILLDSVSRGILEAEWNAMQQAAMVERDVSNGDARDGMIKALEHLKAGFQAEAKDIDNALPLGRRLLNRAFGDMDASSQKQKITVINHAIAELKSENYRDAMPSVIQTLNFTAESDQRTVLKTGTPMTGLPTVSARNPLSMSREDWVNHQASVRLSDAGLASTPEKRIPSLEAMADLSSRKEKVYKDFADYVAQFNYPLKRQDLNKTALQTIATAYIETRHSGVYDILKEMHNQKSSPDKKDLQTISTDTEPSPVANLVSINAHEWWTGQRVAIENWGRSLEEIEADMKLLGPEPPLDKVFCFDKAGQSVLGQVDNADQLGEHGTTNIFLNASEVNNSNSDASSIARSKNDVDTEPKPVLRGVLRLGENMIDTTMALYQGKGDYLQGFVKVNGEKHQVLAFINERQPDPKTGETKPSFITLSEPSAQISGDTLWNQIGHGNAINRRADGKPVFFDEVLFNVGGTFLKSKVTQQVDSHMHNKLGFVEPRKERDITPILSKDNDPVMSTPIESSITASVPKKRLRA
jgi:hypothetical protein